jgi:hypothetical protein
VPPATVLIDTKPDAVSHGKRSVPN